MSSVGSRMIVHRENTLPWIAASFLVMAAYLAGMYVRTPDFLYHRIVLTLALCSVVAATEMVLLRSRRIQEEASRDHRARPASDELTLPPAGGSLPADRMAGALPPYAAGQLQYSSAVVELLEHAVGVALARDLDATELASGRDDAAALHDLLTTMAVEPVHLRKAAKVHTICSLWEASQDRLERAAAELDPEFHCRWRARHLAVLRLRHGAPPAREVTTLPYRDATSE